MSSGSLGMCACRYSPAAFGLDMSVKNMPKPRARINAQASPVSRPGDSFGCAVPSVARVLCAGMT